MEDITFSEDVTFSDRSDSVEVKAVDVKEDAKDSEVKQNMQKSYRRCSKCMKNVKRVRFAEHLKRCTPLKICEETNDDGTVCGVKYNTEKWHKNHCKCVEGKRRKGGTCQRLYQIDPFVNWTCPKPGCGCGY